MVLPLLLRELAEEKVVLLKPASVAKLPFKLKGIVRLVDNKGKTLGLVLNKEILEEIGEEMEAQDPAFLKALDASKKSGKVSSRLIKKKIGIK